MYLLLCVNKPIHLLNHVTFSGSKCSIRYQKQTISSWCAVIFLKKLDKKKHYLHTEISDDSDS